ncbi:MAG: Vms1/Ankzf1 family peptidyl-tRNA hydrolase [Nitrospirota bacterium]
MFNREELKEIAKIHGEDSFFISLYLNVNPVTNAKNDYVIHLKNMLKQTSEKLDKNVLKKINNDLEKIESYVMANKRIFKKGLVVFSSQEKNFWREFHLAIPIKNEIIVDNTPYIKPILDILDNYQRYAILLVGRDSARLFMIHLGEIEEYTEVHTDDVPGRHKKGGWFSLSEKSYERHIDYHVEIHLKDVLKKLEQFLSHEYVGRLIIGGSEEAVTKIKSMLPQTIADKVIGMFQAEMFANNKDILEKIEPIMQAYEKKKEDEEIDELLTKAMKNENAVIGIEDVLNALQEGRLMKVIFRKDFKKSGLVCKNCGYLSIHDISKCPYCKGELQKVSYIVDLLSQKAVHQGVLVEVVTENKKLQDAGNIGAFLRF